MMTSPEQLEALIRRLEEVEAELLRTRTTRKAPGGRRCQTRGPWLGAALLVVATWVLAAQAPATLPPDVEERLRALESLVRRGPGNVTQLTAPFEVLSVDGKPVVRVGGIPDSKVPVSIGVIPQGGGVISLAEGGAAQAVMSALGGRGEFAALDAKQVTRATLLGTGSMAVFDATGEQLAGVTQGDAGGGRLGIWRGGKRVVDITTDAEAGGSGLVSINTPSGQSLARLSAADGAGELLLSNAQGARLAVLGSKNGAGAATVMNSAGKPAAGLLGSGAGGGIVGVAGSSGVTLAQMSVTDDGRGLVQIFSPRSGSPLAVLTQAADRVGGLVQISNEKTSVANLTVGGAGAGYLQLADATGNPTVEAGTLPDGNGTVRAGPTYQCLKATLSGPISTVPNCIMGGGKK